MKIDFAKMQGLGNDFIVIDNMKGSYASVDFVSFAKKFCDRNFGIGADGVLIVSKSGKADANMRLINADGSEAEMCGNGIRCVARYLLDAGAKSPVKIETLAGIMEIAGNGCNYRVDMGIPKVGESRKIRHFTATLVDMGNPHAVVFVDDFDFDWEAEGKVIENDTMFPNRTNVEFVRVKSKGELEVKVWERGAGSTLACGTGACASLAAASSLGKTGKKATVLLRGGCLEVELSPDGHIHMTGPAEAVFSGSVDLA